MAILKKDLISLRKEFKVVVKQMEMLLKTVEKSNKAPKDATKKAVTRKTVLAKVTQKAPVRKVAAQKKGSPGYCDGSDIGNHQTI